MTDKDNKLHTDTIMLQKKIYHKQVREMLERLGVKPDEIIELDTDENIPVLMQAKELVKKISKSNMFEKEENGRYKIYAKITAITVMTASVGMMDDFGIGKEARPYFTGVSEWLGIPIDTLRSWWAKQTTIMREQISIGSAAVQRVTLKQLEIAEKYTDGLHEISEEEIKKLRQTPRGIAVMQKVAMQSIYLAKLLNIQGEIISKADTQKETKTIGKEHGVTIMFPVESEKPKTKKKGKPTDASDITDRG